MKICPKCHATLEDHIRFCPNDGTRLGPLGSVLIDRYRLDREIGQGPLGTVYAATDFETQSQVAVKLFNEALLDTETTDLLLNEIQAVADLQNPAFMPVLDGGPLNQTIFLVSPFLENLSLQSFLASGPMDVNRAIRVSCDLFSALDQLHQLQFCHFDLKPENLFLVKDALQNERTIVDGIGQHHLLGLQNAQFREHCIVDPEYISPEHLRGQPAGVTSDIYLAGLLMYEMLTQHVPFAGDSLQTTARRHTLEDPPSPSAIRPEIPQALDRIVLKCISKQPSQRYQSASELLSDLLPLKAASAPQKRPAGLRLRLGDASRTPQPLVQKPAAPAEPAPPPVVSAPAVPTPVPVPEAPTSVPVPEASTPVPVPEASLPVAQVPEASAPVVQVPEASAPVVAQVPEASAPVVAQVPEASAPVVAQIPEPPKPESSKPKNTALIEAPAIDPNELHPQEESDLGSELYSVNAVLLVDKKPVSNQQVTPTPVQQKTLDYKPSNSLPYLAPSNTLSDNEENSWYNQNKEQIERRQWVYSDQQPHEKERNFLPFVIVGLALIAGVALYFLLPHGSDKKKNDAPKPEVVRASSLIPKSKPPVKPATPAASLASRIQKTALKIAANARAQEDRAEEDAAAKKQADDDAAAKLAEEEAAKKKAEEAAAAKLAEEAAAKKAEEAAAKQTEEAAAKKKKAEDEAAAKLAEEAAAKKKKAEEEAAKKLAAEEAAAKLAEEAAAKKKKAEEEAAKKKADDDATQKKADEEAAKKKARNPSDDQPKTQQQPADAKSNSSAASSQPSINDSLKQGQEALKKKQFDTAKAAFEEVLRRDSKNAAAYAGLGAIAISKQDFNAASQQFEKALRYSPNSDAYFTYLGLSYFKLDQLARARGYLQKALQLNPQNKNAERYLEAVNAKLGQ